MTNPTPTSGAADLPEALYTIQRYEVVDCIDSKHVPAVIPNPHGPWVRYEDHLAALAGVQTAPAAVQPALSAAQAGVPVDAVALEAALRAIEQAIGLIGEPADERMRAVRRVLRGAVIVADDAAAPQHSLSPAPAQPGQEGERDYPPLPPHDHYHQGRFSDPVKGWSAASMRAYVDAARAARTAQAPAVPAVGVNAEQRRMIDVIADKIEDGTLFQSGIYSRKDLARFVRNMLDATSELAQGAGITPAPFGWVKSAEVESARAHGGSINLWLKKYDCDTPIFAAAPRPEQEAQRPDAGLSKADADLLEKAISDFEDCGETDVLDADLRRFAAMGYLECTLYHTLPAAQDAIDSARAAQQEPAQGVPKT